MHETVYELIISHWFCFFICCWIIKILLWGALEYAVLIWIYIVSSDELLFSLESNVSLAPLSSSWLVWLFSSHQFWRWSPCGNFWACLFNFMLSPLFLCLFFQYLPMPVLFGLFFYMGFSALKGLQVGWLASLSTELKWMKTFFEVWYLNWYDCWSESGFLIDLREF